MGIWEETNTLANMLGCCSCLKCCFPGQYGIPKPWYFPFTASHWCGTTSGMDDDPDLLKDAVAQSGTFIPC